MFFNLFGKKDEAGTKEILSGEVIHYFSKVKAAVVKVKKEPIAVGDHIKFKGHTTDFDQKVKSLQVQHEQVKSASKGMEVAIKVNAKTRAGDQVFVLRKTE